MEPMIIDFETFYDIKLYSLSKMSARSYVLDPRFEVIGAAMKWPDDKAAHWHTGRDLDQQISRIESHQHELIAVGHHMVFDGTILSAHYGIKPAELSCTLSMARSTGLSLVSGLSLAALSDLAREAGVQIPPKGNEVHAASGMRLADFSAGQLAAYGRYCVTDTGNCDTLFRLFMQSLPVEELLFQSSVLRMYTDPHLVINRGIVEAELQRVRDRRAAALSLVCQRLGVADEQMLLRVIGSNTKLAEALKLFGAEPPMKTSKTTGKPTFAFGKTDSEFLAMTEHDIPEVAALVEARLDLKSSIEETRCLKFMDMEPLGLLPVPLKVSGAHTHRLSGEGDWNPQNLPSGRKPGQSKALKESLEVPPGRVITGGDSSQVEVRVLDYCANDQIGLQNFRDGVCPYSAWAANFWPTPGVTAADVKRMAKQGDELWGFRRQLAKVVILSSGFGIGPRAFREYAKVQSGIDLSFKEAKEYNRGYKDGKPAIPRFWKTADKVLHLLADGEGCEFGGPTGKLFTADPDRRVLGQRMPGILLPDGMWLTYPGIEFVEVEEFVDLIDEETGDIVGREKQWREKCRFWTKKGRANVPNYTWGGVITENCLAGDSEVLTDRGWVRLDAVQPDDKVHDGVEFVSHDGLIERGLQPTVVLGGVSLTADHKVLVGDVWLPAGELTTTAGTTQRVYDLLNCGPRHRFSVQWLGPTPLIVSNCVQAVAFGAMKFQAGLLRYPLILNEHDAHYVASSVDDAADALANLRDAMQQTPPWAPGLPLSCEAGQSGSIGALVKR